MLAVAGPAALRLRVTPARLRAGRRLRLRFRVSGGDGCAARAVIRVAGRRIVTNARGRATLRLRARRPGRLRVRATKRGCTAARMTLRVAR